MEAKNVVIITLDREKAQELLNLIDDLHLQFQKGESPDIGLLLKLGDVLEAALKVE